MWVPAREVYGEHKGHTRPIGKQRINRANRFGADAEFVMFFDDQGMAGTASTIDADMDPHGAIWTVDRRYSVEYMRHGNVGGVFPKERWNLGGMYNVATCTLDNQSDRWRSREPVNAGHYNSTYVLLFKDRLGFFAECDTNERKQLDWGCLHIRTRGISAVAADIGYYSGTGAYASQAAVYEIPANTWKIYGDLNIAVVSWNIASQTLNCIVNGVHCNTNLVGALANLGTKNAYSDFDILLNCRNNTTSRRPTGVYQFFAHINRYSTIEECFDLYRNPYQIIEPDRDIWIDTDAEDVFVPSTLEAFYPPLSAFRSQPDFFIGRTEPVRVNWEERFTDGLIGCYAFQHLYNLVDLLPGTLNSQAHLDKGKLYLDGANDHLELHANTKESFAFGLENFLIIVRARYEVVSGTADATLISHGIGVVGSWRFSYDESIGRVEFWGDDQDINPYYDISLTAGQTYTFAVYRDGATAKVFVDGVEGNNVDTTSAHNLNSTVNTPQIGGANDTAGYYWEGDIEFAFVWRGLHAPEEVALKVMADPNVVVKSALDLLTPFDTVAAAAPTAKEFYELFFGPHF